MNLPAERFVHGCSNFWAVLKTMQAGVGAPSCFCSRSRPEAKQLKGHQAPQICLSPCTSFKSEHQISDVCPSMEKKLITHLTRTSHTSTILTVTSVPER
eukprot:scaffold293874_cov14-Tisochrysis_lutea.AAC.1